MRVLRLNCVDLQRTDGAGALLHELLSLVVEWAAAEGMPVNDAEWRKAQAVLADGPKGSAMLTRAGRALVDLFVSGFQAPVLVLLDELQALLHPTITDAGGKDQLDRAGASYIRNVVLRRILVDCPTRVLWAVTGSGMALAWIALAAMPVSGTAPLNKICPVHLPSAFSPRLMRELVGHSLRRLGLQSLLEEMESQHRAEEAAWLQHAAKEARPQQQAAEEAARLQHAAKEARLPQQAAEEAARPQQAAELEAARLPQQAAEAARPQQQAAEEAARLPQQAAEEARLQQQAAEEARLPQVAEETQPPQPHQQQQRVGQMLLERSNNSPALFVTLLIDWASMEEQIEDMATFLDNLLNAKLVAEVKKEWLLSLAHMSDEDRGRVLDLANPVLGAQITDFPDLGLWRFLEPHLRTTVHGRYYLVDRLQRQLLQAVIDRGGKLRENFTGLGMGLTLVQLDWACLLRQLGEVADHLVGQRRRSQNFPSHVDDGAAVVVAMLEDFATKAKAKLPNGAPDWEALPAFKQALASTHNKGARAWYEQEGKGNMLQGHLDHLVFFLRMCRNVLAHNWQQDQQVEILQELVLALPEMLGMSVQDLAERVRVDMSKLAPSTVKAATAAADAEDAEEGEEDRAIGTSAINTGARDNSASSTGARGAIASSTGARGTSSSSTGARDNSASSAGARGASSSTTGARGTSASSAGTRDTGARGASVSTTAARGTGASTTAARGASSITIGARDTSASSAGARGTSASSTGARDTRASSAGARDTSSSSIGARATSASSTGARGANASSAGARGASSSTTGTRSTSARSAGARDTSASSAAKEHGKRIIKSTHHEPSHSEDIGRGSAGGGEYHASRGAAAPAMGGCFKVSTTLSNGALAARRCLLMGEAVVPHVQAMLPVPIRHYPVRATPMPASFLFR